MRYYRPVACGTYSVRSLPRIAFAAVKVKLNQHIIGSADRNKRTVGLTFVKAAGAHMIFRTCHNLKPGEFPAGFRQKQFKAFRQFHGVAHRIRFARMEMRRKGYAAGTVDFRDFKHAERFLPGGRAVVNAR